MPEISRFEGDGRDAGSDRLIAAGFEEPAGAALARRSRFLEATLSSIPDFVYAFDPQGRFVYATPAMRNRR
jgi:PAS domain-containing protein